MKKFSEFLEENKLAKGAKTGDVVKVGYPGHRNAGHLARVTSHTKTTMTVGGNMATYDRNTALQKGSGNKPTLGKTPVIHKASTKDIDDNYRNKLIDNIKSMDTSKMTTSQLEKHVKLHGEHKNTEFMFYHFKRGHVSSKKDM